MPKVASLPEAHFAVKLAATRLREHFAVASELSADMREYKYLVAVGEAINKLKLPERTFAIYNDGERIIFTGDRPRSVLAGVLYYIHHSRLRHRIELPLQMTSPFKNRLVMEDFPFMCYWPTGFDFDTEKYAENLVALGFTGMECNRFSPSQPMKPLHWNYAFTNPSPSYFVWTDWHAGVWSRELIEANATELRRCVDVAVQYELEPTLTSFLPRPYPEEFWVKHPHLKGPGYQNEYMRKTGHPTVYCLDTDKAEVKEFYKEVYDKIFDAFPEIRHLFFWHGDIGTTFKSDDGKTQLQRIAEFHEMLQMLLKKRNMKTKVWLNPWTLDIANFEDVDILPGEVNFSIKDNAGLKMFSGTSSYTLFDASIITAQLGSTCKKVLELGKQTARDVCVAQYQDFSEDLDPIVAVPHPIMTFRKLRKSEEISTEYLSANWGLISPEVADVNINQDVIRELTWGLNAATFYDLIYHIVPSELGEEQLDMVYRAWRYIDSAIRSWPQFWGLRLQDSGLRLRWLVKPFGFSITENTGKKFEFILERQIYRDCEPAPFKAFMNIIPSQAKELAVIYSDMIEQLYRAHKYLLRAQTESESTFHLWFQKQLNSLKTLTLFWITYRNLLGFWGWFADSEPSNEKVVKKCRGFIESEIKNVSAIISHLGECPETIIVAKRYAWGQCFGPDYLDEFKNKLKVMEEDNKMFLASCCVI